MTDDATYRKMKQERDLALADNERNLKTLEANRVTIDRLTAGCERLRIALEETRKCLGEANEAVLGPICDTIWYSDSETLFDFIDAAIDAARAKP